MSIDETNGYIIYRPYISGEIVTYFVNYWIQINEKAFERTFTVTESLVTTN